MKGSLEEFRVGEEVSGSSDVKRSGFDSRYVRRAIAASVVGRTTMIRRRERRGEKV